MEKFSVTSLLLGGLISYIIWFIQKYITTKSERKRVAFFYLVKVCEILALKKTFDLLLKKEFAELKEKIGDDKHALHLFCVGFSKLLNNNIEAVTEENKELITNLGNFLRRIFDHKQDYFGYKIDDDIVSRFPQSAILKYHFFIKYIRSLEIALTMWITCLDKYDFKIFTSDILYGQIDCVKNVYSSSESLVVSLAKESGIKMNAVNDIIQKQYKEFSAKGLAAC